MRFVTKHTIFFERLGKSISHEKAGIFRSRLYDSLKGNNKFALLIIVLLLVYSKNSFAQRKIIPSLATWHMDSALFDLAAAYTPFKTLVNLRSIARDKDLMTNAVHDEIKRRAQYAKEKGISLVADLDPRLTMPTFEARYPNELQQMLIIKEVELKGKNNVEAAFKSRNLQDHYQRSYPVRAGSFVKAYKYNLTPSDLIDSVSLKEISNECVVRLETKDSINIMVPDPAVNGSSHLLVMVLFTYQYPDVFAPHLMCLKNPPP